MQEAWSYGQMVFSETAYPTLDGVDYHKVFREKKN
jgi:hypothetical protein